MSSDSGKRSSKQIRPNGSRAACDPCRARKVACDHAEPTCSRCRSKNRAAECVYSANATRRSKAAGQLPRTAGQEQPAVGTPRSSKRSRSSVHLGFTSSLEETQSALLPNTQNSVYTQISPSEQAIETHRLAFAQLPLSIRETCLSVLRALPGQKNAQMVYLEGDFKPKGWLHLAVHRIIKWLQSVLSESLHRKEQETLEHVAQIISRNTSRPLHGPYPDWESWVARFTGENTRWESIGLLWTHIERVSDILDALIPRKLVRSENNTSSGTAKYHVEHCIRLTRHFTDESDLLADLYRRRSILVSFTDGELGLPLWEAHGTAVNYAIFLNLHREDGTTLYKPTAWSENNRRLAATIFIFDKIGVMLTGLPPLLSRRYYTTQLPLDLRDEDLIAGHDDLSRAIASLDERGWNTDGGLYPATVTRARFMLAIVRDELIEATLSTGYMPSFEHVMDLKNREFALIAEFPVGLRYTPCDLEPSPADINCAYIRIITHLEHLQNLFFIDRLILRCGYTVSDSLLETSMALANLTLQLWTHKDRFANSVMQRSSEWLMLSYGAPAAGILCQEALGAGEHRKDPSISRSTVIQQLSLLVGFLDWVRPSAPNAKLCANCKNIIEQVLDQCLNTTVDPIGPDLSMWDFGDQPDFNFELLDTFDWVRAAEA